MPAGDLTNLASVRAFLAVPADDTSRDATFASLITSLSARFLTLIDRQLLSASYTDTVGGKGGTVLCLENYPVTLVTSVTVDGDLIPQRPNVKGAGWVLSKGFRIDLAGSYVFTEGISNVVVQYTAGYTAIPVDVSQALNEWVAWVDKIRDRVGLVSQNVGGETLSYSPYGAPHSVQNVIDSYRRPA